MRLWAGRHIFRENFREHVLGELRRITLPRTPLNKRAKPARASPKTLLKRGMLEPIRCLKAVRVFATISTCCASTPWRRDIFCGI